MGWSLAAVTAMLAVLAALWPGTSGRASGRASSGGSGWDLVVARVVMATGMAVMFVPLPGPSWWVWLVVFGADAGWLGVRLVRRATAADRGHRAVHAAAAGVMVYLILAMRFGRVAGVMQMPGMPGGATPVLGPAALVWSTVWSMVLVAADLVVLLYVVASGVWWLFALAPSLVPVAAPPEVIVHQVVMSAATLYMLFLVL